MVTLRAMEVIALHQTERDDDREELQRELLREELHGRFPAEDGYEVSEGTWIDVVEGHPELMPVTVVIGNGVGLTFFSRAPNHSPGMSQPPEYAEVGNGMIGEPWLLRIRTLFHRTVMRLSPTPVPPSVRSRRADPRTARSTRER